MHRRALAFANHCLIIRKEFLFFCFIAVAARRTKMINVRRILWNDVLRVCAQSRLSYGIRYAMRDGPSRGVTRSARDIQFVVIYGVCDELMPSRSGREPSIRSLCVCANRKCAIYLTAGSVGSFCMCCAMQ